MQPTHQNPWLLCLRPKPSARLRLFGFHHMGGGTLLFHKWHALMPPQVEFVAVRLPGRESRIKEQSFRHIGPIINELVRTVLPQLDKPVAFIGHSMGALIAFELARELRRRALPAPVRLFSSACPAPHLINTQPRWLHLNDADFIESLKVYGGLPEQVLDEPDLMRMLIPTLRADREVFETYEYSPEPALELPVTVFGGIDDPAVQSAKLLEWARHTTDSFDHHMFPGGHFFLNDVREELVGLVADALRG